MGLTGKYMSAVDPDDNTQDCFLVQHYRFDENRNERRLIVVAAYSTRREAIKNLKQRQKELTKLQEVGLAESSEYLCSGPQRAGQKSRAAQTRIELKKMRSGWVAQGLTKRQTRGKPDTPGEG